MRMRLKETSKFKRDLIIEYGDIDLIKKNVLVVFKVSKTLS